MRSKRAPLTITALGVFFASVTNAHAHIHLCFDGQQPPVTIHGAQDADHAHLGDQHDADHHQGDPHDAGEQNCHGDLDLDLDADGLAKSFKPDLPAIAPQNVTALTISTLAAPAPIANARDPGGTEPPHTRPPSRAPPSTLL